MSDSARHDMFYIAESTFGVTPTSPAFKGLRHTGTTLGLTKSGLLSAELRPDREISDFRHGVKQVGGDIEAELSYGSFDDLLQAVLCGTWTQRSPQTKTTLAAVASGNKITDSSNTLPILFPGEHVTIAGFVNGANNSANAVVVASTINQLILSGITFVNESAGPSVTITPHGAQLKVGTTRRSFSFLRNFADQSGADEAFHLYKGVELSKLALNVKIDSIITASFGVMGQQPELAQTAPSGTTYVAKNTLSVMDSFNCAVVLDAIESPGVVSELSLTLETGMATRFSVGSDVTAEPSIGRSNLTGQITVYFEDSALLRKFMDEDEASLSLRIADEVGNVYWFVLPRIKYNGGQPDVKGAGPIFLTMPFQAMVDTSGVYNTSFLIVRSPKTYP